MRHMITDRETAMKLADWLTRAMSEAGVTHAELAALLDVSRTVITKSANGTRRLQIDEVLKIARVLKQAPPPEIGVASERLPSHNLPLLGHISETTWKESGGVALEKQAPISIAVKCKYPDREQFGYYIVDGYAKDEYAVCVDAYADDIPDDRSLVVVEHKKFVGSDVPLLTKLVIRRVVHHDGGTILVNPGAGNDEISKDVSALLRNAGRAPEPRPALRLVSDMDEAQKEGSTPTVGNEKIIALVVGFFRVAV